MLRVTLHHATRLEPGCCAALKLGHQRRFPQLDLRRHESSSAGSGSSLLPQADDFAERHIGPRLHDQAKMLSMLGFKVSYISTTTYHAVPHTNPYPVPTPSPRHPFYHSPSRFFPSSQPNTHASYFFSP